ncbi:MAG TPA: hypothetical protein VJ698_10625 [Noviherbaspirillum sp.]|uniref:pilus assembly PilX family protein n=1 Tax=Noviherbaspirillum sp. TaxID=1926288 RepID=UPI002B4827BB|nr:hypothetical protein [Noviherbaspirillum sp.]HJV85920.1 hypothetical protein [Noviherbaspirillum sp.]
MSNRTDQREGCSIAGKGVRLQRQRGVILIVALIVLVAMTLASIAMVRSVDTSTIIAGNLAFKQSGAAAGDAAIDAAVGWLTANNGPTLEADSGSDGYYATSQDSLDITGNRTPGDASDDLDWLSSAAVKILAPDGLGNKLSYVIHRMCNSAGPLAAGTCATDQSAMAGSSLGASRQMMTYQPGSWNAVANRAYYRITVRIAGPRNSVNFVQSIVSQ